MLCLAIVCFGFIMTHKMAYRKKYLEKLEVFARSCVADMRCTKSNVVDIIKKYAECELQFFDQLDEQSVNDVEAINDILLKAELESCDIEFVKQFLLKLGDTDLEGQKSHCDYYAEKFEALKMEAAKELNEKGKISRSLFVLGGIAVFVIFI